MEIYFEIEGKVVGKGRPRFARMGNFVRTYSTQQDVSYENWVKTCFLNSVYNDFKPIENEIDVTIIAQFEIPKSISNKKRQMMLDLQIRPTKKPDCDNIAKSICDALNKVAYKDDSQIVNLIVHKIYGENEKCLVKIIEKRSDENE